MSLLSTIAWFVVRNISNIIRDEPRRQGHSFRQWQIKHEVHTVGSFPSSHKHSLDCTIETQKLYRPSVTNKPVMTFELYQQLCLLCDRKVVEKMSLGSLPYLIPLMKRSAMCNNFLLALVP